MITIKNKKDIAALRRAGQELSRILKEVRLLVKPGITTIELDRKADYLIKEKDYQAAFKNYNGFPKTLCTSVNEAAVHQIPSDYKLKEGDLLSLDIGLIKDGYYADMAFTIGIGEVTEEAQRLMKITHQSLKAGIKRLQPGKTLGDVGNAIQKVVESNNFTIVEDLCGHGIGHDLHEDPNVFNYGQPGRGLTIRPGMVFCLEPIASTGGKNIKRGPDGQSYITKDHSLTAHYEHMVAVTPEGPVVLTSF